jgi:3-oxoacyl-[acyl-carrier protein] reductase
MFDFTRARVVVCGASRGIGRSIALGFARAGADLAICARGGEALEATAGELAALGARVHAAVCDLADAEAVRNYVSSAAEGLGGIDVLVNNASGFGGPDEEDAWQAGISVDVMSTVRASRAALPFLERSRGCIVNVSSICAYGASTRWPAYAAVKALLVNYTQSQAALHGPKGVRVNGVAPGAIEFPGGHWEAQRTAEPALYEATVGSTPFGRLGSPEEVADIVQFLASPLARWVTGHTVVVDGGHSLVAIMGAGRSQA